MTNALIVRLIPPAKRGGNKRTLVEREVVNGIMYILATGCQWACVPQGPAAPQHGERLHPPLADDGTLGRIHHALYAKCREQAGREASPTAVIIDSQSVKAAEKRGVCIAIVRGAP